MLEVLDAPSLLDLRGRMGLHPHECLTITHLSGSINGQSFTGSGVGVLDPVSGHSRSEIELFNFPQDFAVPLCKSWKCKHHKNPQKLVAYREEATIRYSEGARGAIYTVGDVRRLATGVSLCFNVFDGKYVGPTEVEKIFPWKAVYQRVDNRCYLVTCTRRLVAEGRLVEARWDGKLIVMEGEEVPGFSIDFVQEEFTWARVGSSHRYTETLCFR